MENIFTSSKPFLLLGKIVGIFPMSFVGPTRKGILKTNWIDLIPFCCTLGILIFLFALHLLLDMFNVRDSMMVSYGWSLARYSEYSSYVFLLSYQLLKRQNIVRFLKQVQRADDEAKNLKVIVNLRSHRCHLLRLMLIVVVVLIVMVILSPLVIYLKSFSTRTVGISILSSFVVTILKFSFFAQLMLSCLCLRKRFEILHENIKWSIVCSNQKVFMNNSASWVRIGRIYQSLCNGIEIINETFTIHFVFLFGNILVRKSKLRVFNISF